MSLKLSLTAPPQIVFREADHTYWIIDAETRGKTEVPSFSQRLEDAERECRRILGVEHVGFRPNYGGVSDEVLANARARGSAIDDACSLIMEGRFTANDWIKLHREAKDYVMAYLTWWRGSKPVGTLRVQTPLYCRQLDTCCMPDFHDDESVNDVKAQAKQSREWGLRLAMMALAHGSATIERAIWLRPHLKRSQYEVHTRNQMDRRIFSKWDSQVVEAICLQDYDAEAIKQWFKEGQR